MIIILLLRALTINFMMLPDIVLILIWSVLSEDMAKDGYENIVNIDISSVVIEQMREKHKEITQLTCSVC
jgi:hypothetical protein